MPTDNHTFVGRSLGRYQILRVLGRGAMGVVYEGLDTRLARTVAIKTVQRSFLADEATAADYAARFEREAQAAARLHHPHIVTLFDFGEQDDVSYIVMEFIRGRELAQAFRNGERFTLPQVQRLMAELLDALGAAHEHGIVHRDVKPANVLIDEQGRVKLADFGVARVADGNQDRTMPGTMVGTPSAMAPEQILGLAVGSRTDIFSAGLIGYQLLTGQRPFVGSGPFDVQRAIVHDDAQPPSAINPALPAAVDAVLARALAKKPERRYETAAAFSAALTAALSTAVAPAAAPASPAVGAGARVPGGAPAAVVGSAPSSPGVDLDLDRGPAAISAPPLPAPRPSQPVQALPPEPAAVPARSSSAPASAASLPAPVWAPAGAPAVAAAAAPTPAPAPGPASAPAPAPPAPQRWALPLGLAVAAVVLLGAGSWALRPRTTAPAAAAPTPPVAQQLARPAAPEPAVAPAPAPAAAGSGLQQVSPATAPVATAADKVAGAVPATGTPAATAPPLVSSVAPVPAAARAASAAGAAPRSAPVRAADSKPRPSADPRCAELLARIQLGDSLTPEQTTLFHTRCAR
jgi:serine/threonine-protein kinase